MSKKKIFVSFDVENDSAFKNIIVGKSQEQGAKFKVANWSMKPDTKNPKWLKEAKFKVTRCDVMVVMVGENTHRAPGVIKEVEFATNANMKIIQINATDGDAHSINDAGVAYDLKSDDLAELLN
ncbi:TIR domain-containing protein [Pseudemcibacter aquimaris]|uniref:TIR domain-containing protein n=1 Tax=Pseudemcibacter aquimaris TaxID=2857064 RepID=UPI002012D1F5|nr:TIR domain-containing protein [Pseudemcibacter aquimaris]MCC3860513.1 hypothetical protein [Pseudemcibacter aquimaris]WDU59338.1 TIR domain-containing protein [Pseudemcibacter aquimaris]